MGRILRAPDGHYLELFNQFCANLPFPREIFCTPDPLPLIEISGYCTGFYLPPNKREQHAPERPTELGEKSKGGVRVIILFIHDEPVEWNRQGRKA